MKRPFTYSTTMLMTNENIVLAPFDRLLGATIVRFVPSFVRPNHWTVLRIVLIPVVLWLFWIQNWPWALGVFIFAALTDAIDGAQARLRKQITLWGTMADPVADKLLIGSAVALFVAREVSLMFAVVIVLIELLIVAGAMYRRSQGRYSSANGYGKIKMFFQILGVCLLLLAKVAGLPLAVPFAVGTLSLAIAFAVISLLTYSS
ncbi:CDP-alcohol phosphatidyltransferase family protein [Candidatus Uhrbacteria bacterium]|nr:CDP-alcohol phosphatidyltransferase family protein [Candidatus Uhrbacteria bacterium]